MTPTDPQDPRALDALTEHARRSLKPHTTAELSRGLSELRTRLAERRGQRVTLRASLYAALVVAVLGTLGFLWLRPGTFTAQPPVALHEIQGGTLTEGGYLSQSGSAEMKLLFNEGSEFVLAAGSRGRLRSVESNGARLAIEQGTASFRITHRPEQRWTVEAGPFVVTVKGTEFTVLWEPASEQFELWLRRGRVTVTGPVISEELSVRSGQKLSVSLPRAESILTEDRADPKTDAPSSSSAVPAAPEAAAPQPSEAAPNSASSAQREAPPGAPTGSPERRWKTAFAQGQWDVILSEAERDGVEVTLQTASSDDLFALADAARYRRRVDLARAALLTQKRRFPNSPRSLDALFLLGRVEESRPSGRAAAITWYEEYLARAPRGTYASEALGRKMTLVNEADGAASARPIAVEYLRRFPKGSYAGAASALQRVP